MNALATKLDTFLSACGGNWRNTICVFAQGARYLMAMDRDAKPVVMNEDEFRQLTGEPFDSAECCAVLPGSRFRDLYAHYLLWENPTRHLILWPSCAGEMNKKKEGSPAKESLRFVL